MIWCPKCGQTSQVVGSRITPAGSMRRRRKCTTCGERWSTLELLDSRAALVEKIGLVFTPVAPPIGKRPSHGRTPRRHNIQVPPEMEADWLTYKKNGFTDFEAARALKLPIPEQKP
jgi:hypothetical protein